MAFLFCCTSTLEPTNKIGFVNSLALLREGYHEGIIHDITSYHQYQPFATNSLVFHCYIRWAEDNVNNPSYGVFTYTYIPNRYKSHHGVGDAVFRSIVSFSPARNGRIAHQPVNGTIPSELVQLFCKIVNGVLRLFDVMRIEQAEYPALLQGGHSCPQENKDGTNSIGILSIDKYPGIFLKSGNCNCISITTLFPVFCELGRINNMYIYNL